jgi:uncharacterized membrane protein
MMILLMIIMVMVVVLISQKYRGLRTLTPGACNAHPFTIV